MRVDFIYDSWSVGGAEAASPSSPSSTSSRDLPPGSSIGEYLVDRLVAYGGCGSVYLARHTSSGRCAAVKVLHSELAQASLKMTARFAREVEILQRLRHPHIVEIYEVGTLPGGTPFYAMEYLPGATLDNMLSTRGRLSAEETLGVIEPVCLALQAAHAAGIVHRDVKGSNIVMVGEDPATIKLLDFGIAKLVSPEDGGPGLSSSGRMMGTPTIMAPEQLLGRPIDARTDIYALGALTYRCLTGKRPFEARHFLDLARQHLERPAPRPSQRVLLRPAIDAVVLRCLEKSPDDRFDSVQSFLQALREAVGQVPKGRAGSIPHSWAGAGIYVEARVRAIQDDDVDEVLVEEIGRVLDFAEGELQRAGFIRVSVTSTEILGVRVLPDDLSEQEIERRSALRLAVSLHDKLVARLPADSRVHVNVALHSEGVLVQGGGPPEILGGPITRTQDWAPKVDLDHVAATPAALDGLDGVVTEPGPGDHALVIAAGRLSGRYPPDAPTLCGVGGPVMGGPRLSD